MTRTLAETFRSSLPFFAVLLMLPRPGVVFANDSTGARGGGSVVLIDREWKLFEVAKYQGKAAPTYPLSPETRTLLEGIRKLFEVYTGYVNPRYWSLVAGDLAEYRIVESVGDLPCGTAHSSGGRLTYGCTQDGITYLARSVFMDKLDSRTQLFSLLHERAHALDGSASAHAWIEPFIAGLETLVALRSEQERKTFRALDAVEMMALDRLLNDPGIRGAMDAGPVPAKRLQTRIYKFGGGLVRLPLDMPLRHVELEDAYLSVDSLLDYGKCRWKWNYAAVDPITVAHVTILSSRVECASFDGMPSTIENSVLEFRIVESKNRIAAMSGAKTSNATIQIASTSIKINGLTANDMFMVMMTPPPVVFNDLKVADGDYDWTRFAVQTKIIFGGDFRTPRDNGTDPRRKKFTIDPRRKKLTIDNEPRPD